jgi:3'-phosphoadenosine 5'-phosphosulfate sulfotransferase (PAPS reductase)/FAD synthetase
MEISKALPQKKYIEAAKRAKTDEFQALKNKTIERVRTWYDDPKINQDVIPGLWFGYGKDSMATAIILELAEVDYCNLIIDCGAELPRHYDVLPEWEDYINSFGNGFYYEEYLTDDPFPLIIKKYLGWGNSYGLKTKDGQPLNFWDWGEMRDSISYEAIYQFQHNYGDGNPNVMCMWGNRGAEGMERQFEISREGLIQFRDQDKKDYLPYVRGLPIGDWLDIDVWALLVEEDAPISPIYSMHQIPQKKGKPFPRTLWYCSPEILCGTYYKWLARYAPVQLKELCDLFPEVSARLTAK